MDSYLEHTQGLWRCRNWTRVLSFNIKVHEIQNCTNRHEKESMDVISWKGRTDRVGNYLWDTKKERSGGLPWGVWTSSFEEHLYQLGSGRKQLAHFSGISDKSLMKGLFTKLRAGIRGICRRCTVCWAHKSGVEVSACPCLEGQGKWEVTWVSASPQQALCPFIEEFSQSRFNPQTGMWGISRPHSYPVAVSHWVIPTENQRAREPIDQTIIDQLARAQCDVKKGETSG